MAGDDEEHYTVLGLPSGELGLRVSSSEIRRAYKRKAFELHPDKRPDDENAKQKFQKLQSSYEVLKDDTSRKLYDDRLRLKILLKSKQRRERASDHDHHRSERKKQKQKQQQQQQDDLAEEIREQAKRRSWEQEQQRLATEFSEKIARNVRLLAEHQKKRAFENYQFRRRMELEDPFFMPYQWF
ncbi:unnamed protein product [Linum trigynum]|uniref:J domain-containing protein n=1 Tax=Linum trigynum TaxID=586398 RepID=A0AAV2D1U4_9ROSI